MTLVLAIVVLFALIIMGMAIPTAFASVIVLLTVLNGGDHAWMLPNAYGKSVSILLMTIPMFVLAGSIMNKGKLGKVLVEWLETLFGRIKGNLVIVSTFACGVFGAVCGSGTATLSCIGSIVSPRMREAKYPLGVVGATLCCAAPLGLLIPPSGIQILVAWSGNLSVLGCFLATAVPGIILMCLLSLVSWIMVRQSPDVPEAVIMPPIEKIKDVGKKTKSAVPALLMPVIILGGIYGGYMTPTESAAVAVLYALPVSIFIYKSLSFKDFKESLLESAITTGVIMILVIFATILSRMLLMENLSSLILQMFSAVSTNPKVILLMVNVLMIIIGMIMDDTSGTLLLTPILLPIMAQIGVSPYHFAAILGVNLGMGNATPPCAPFLYMSSRVCGASTVSMLKPTMMLLLFAYLPTLILTTFIPDVSLWLPSLVLGDKFVG
ncbi:MAG: TRAP transporter large permease [Anaerovoracaceae bacterium]